MTVAYAGIFSMEASELNYGLQDPLELMNVTVIVVLTILVAYRHCKLLSSTLVRLKILHFLLHSVCSSHLVGSTFAP